MIAMKLNDTHIKLLDAYDAAMKGLANGNLDPDAVLLFQTIRRALDPLTLVRLDDHFRRSRVELRLVSNKPIFLENPGLAQLAIHASYGFTREKAVHALPCAAGDAHDLAALLCRCNDHVPQVRTAALARWRAICEGPQRDALSAVLPIVLDRVPNWQRGGRAALTYVERRVDYRLLLETMFLHEATGPLAKRLRFALRGPEMDASLGKLALAAKSPFVRAVATQAVLEGKTRRQVGVTWEWVDKSISLRRRLPKWETRELAIPPAVREHVLRAASNDKSVAVRKLAVDHLTVVGPDGFEDELDLLRRDQRYPIKWRMDFFDRKWGLDSPD